MIGETGAREIPLSKGCVAVVDAPDFEWLSRWSWHVIETPRGRYAGRSTRGGKTYLMHRVILRITDRQIEVDHKNGDRLDNRRQNLRCATKSQNGWNTGPRRHNHSGYKGVHFDKARKLWVAQIRANNRHMFLGRFPTAESAAAAYNAAAVVHHGEFAYQNAV